MHKIYIDKSDSAASVIDRILATQEDEVVLYIPRFTKLASSSNFKLLKREVNSSGKSIEIESVDEEVLDLARSVGIEAANPFFRKNKRAMSDILSPGSEIDKAPKSKSHSRGDIGSRDEEDDSVSVTSHGKYGKTLGKEEEMIDDEEMKAAEEDREEYHHKKHDHHPKFKSFFKMRDKFKFKATATAKKMNSLKVWPVILISAFAVTVGAVVLPTAKIKVTLEKINWDFNGSLIASAAIKDPYLLNGQLKVGGVIFDKSKNIINSYPATGSQSVSRKASGTITVYNAYSSDPQPLVKETRFASPEGKIFRIDRGVVIPGAKIVDNKIVPSSIDLTVYADKAGAEYNIGPAKFRVPGLQGSAKYEGFYGESRDSMSGGFVGVAKVPTESDIIKARDKNKKSLESVLSSEAVLSIPKEMKIIDKATKFIVTKEEINKTTDDAGNFSVTTYGVKKLFGFREADLILALKSQLINEIKLQSSDNSNNASDKEIGLDLKSNSIVYGEPRVDFDKKELSVVLKFKSVWTNAFDPIKFKEAALGKSEEEMADSLELFKGIQSIDVNLWPFWVISVPSNSSKVSIDVE